MWYGGTGYGFEVSYILRSGSLAIGPKIAYLANSFTKEKTDSVTAEMAEAQVESKIQPYFCNSLAL